MYFLVSQQSPKSSSKSRGRERARSKSASRGKSSPTKSPSRRPVTRSRSRTPSRHDKASTVEVVAVKEVKEIKPAPSKTPSRSRPKSKSPSRGVLKETVVTKRTVTSSVLSSSSGQEQAAHTPVRSSSRIASIIEREKEASYLVKEQMKSEMMSSIKTPPPSIPKKKEEKKVNYEFMGPIGAFLMIFLLPFTVYYVNMACRKTKCSIFQVPSLPRNLLAAFFDTESVLIFFGWMVFQALFAVLPIGRVVEGQPLKYGGKLKYRCNGFLALVVSLAGLGIAVYLKLPVTKAVDKFFKLLTVATIFSIALSKCLYLSSRFVSSRKLAPGGNTGNIIYDYFIGRELNPRIGPLDLKFFCELRPGLIGWVVLDWLMVLKAYQETGAFPPNLVLVTVFQTLYVADALWFEDAILTTMDIIHDGFGFMLCFGDLVWVPFLYNLQPRFLLETGFTLPWYCLAPIAVLNLIGYMIFRLSNSQKNLFRKDPKHPVFAGMETVPTQSGRKLLASGWWGMCRKPNYLGDLIMAFAWSLTTGFGHIFTYFYPLYFLVLLIHRERRDNEQCASKYGASWDRYCERVKYRIFPYIY
ncbi:delta(14)-sterol reductase [Elysia marginata]|uniref:Delta(14)-sterol reductase n=1 Tax=Elysia marginata TaxID=1093978 RepID=A0AAV4J432_9GAST|nr:delta(14)-sterol reductase [Elysia marginata]